jgi:nitronate monooxygenase
VILEELSRPIVQAPLAGGPSTPELSAAVGGAGGLGFLAAGYRTAEAVREEIRELRGLTPAPFGVNLFVPGRDEVDRPALDAYVERLGREAERYEVDLGEPRDDDDGWEEKLAVLREERVPLALFTFGCPAAETIESLRQLGTETWVTVTGPQEARVAAAAGANALVLQGIEAGGHRASFLKDDADGLGILALVRLVATGIDLPLVAAGGLADGPAIAGVLAAGASAAQLGTAFLRAPEAGTHPAHAAALASDRPTALTRAFTGRPARGIVNRFMTEHSDHAPNAYPHIHQLTAPTRAAARQRGDADGFNLWAGQAHRLARKRPAAEIVATLSDEARLALQRAGSRSPQGSGA